MAADPDNAEPQKQLPQTDSRRRDRPLAPAWRRIASLPLLAVGSLGLVLSGLGFFLELTTDRSNPEQASELRVLSFCVLVTTGMIGVGLLLRWRRRPGSMASKNKRPWYQFRLSTLLVAVVLIGSACGYVAHEARFVAARKAFLSRRRAWFFGQNPFTIPAKPPLIRRWLGDQSYAIVELDDEDEVPEADSLFPEARLIIRDDLR